MTEFSNASYFTYPPADCVASCSKPWGHGGDIRPPWAGFSAWRAFGSSRLEFETSQRFGRV